MIIRQFIQLPDSFCETSQGPFPMPPGQQCEHPLPSVGVEGQTPIEPVQGRNRVWKLNQDFCQKHQFSSAWNQECLELGLELDLI